MAEKRATAQESTVLAVAILASFVVFLDGSIVNVAVSGIGKDLGGGLSLQQWVVDSYTLSLAAFILLAGGLYDTYGRAAVLRAGLIGFGVASLGCAIAPDGTSLVIFRGFQGLAGALLIPGSLALIASTFRGAAQARAIGRWSAWTSASFIAGPMLGGVFVDTLGWRWVFGINVVPVAVTLLVLQRLKPTVNSTSTARVDLVGALTGVLGLGGIVFALIEQERLGWSNPLVLSSVLVGGIAVVVFLLWESRVQAPMMPLNLFRNRVFWTGNLATFLIWGPLYLGVFIIPVFLQQVVGYSATAAGAATAPMTIISIAVSSTVGSLAGKHGPRWFVTAGPVIAAIGYLWMATVHSPLNIWMQILPGIMLVGFGIATTSTPLTTSVLSSVGAAQAGIGSAVNNAVSRVAGLVAVALLGMITGGTLDYAGFRRVVAVVALFMLLGAGVAAFGMRGIAGSGADADPDGTDQLSDTLEDDAPDGIPAAAAPFPASPATALEP
ncbi:MFS transporter [Streptomyces sp. NPDC059215]|uniref:MFS transporter n=1 Tax=Streptomyces sp. NPDC059215 TaxID=3346772 RepID=UPI003685AA2C